MLWAACTVSFWATLVSLTFPRQLRAFGFTGAFTFYAGMNALAFLMIFLWLPETKQKSVEDTSSRFARSLPTTHVDRTQTQRTYHSDNERLREQSHVTSATELVISRVKVTQVWTDRRND